MNAVRKLTPYTFWPVSQPATLEPTPKRPSATIGRAYISPRRHAPPRRPLPPWPRQALSAHRQARAGARAPQHRDDDVPRDGHAVLAGAGGDAGELNRSVEGKRT